jgi:gliding motility-associated-like protein
VNGNSFAFTNTSVVAGGTITTTTWTFGDGGTSNIAAPTHVYAAAGSYNVKLVVISNSGCTDSITQVVTVYPKPTPSFSVNNAVQCVNGNSFNFINTSTIAGGAIATTNWTFGDGGTSTLPAPSHVYTAAGTYTVKLVVVSNNGCADSTTQTITVNPKPTPAFSINNATQCLNTNNFTFSNTSTVATGSIAFTSWTFGDGGTSTASAPTHIYAADGNYNVKLVVITNNGCRDSITQPVTVHPNPVAGFTVNDNNQCLDGNSFVFLNTSPGGASNGYVWTLGDGSTSTSLNVVKTYTAADTLTVTLTAVSSFGCASNTMSQQVIIVANPIVALGADMMVLEGTPKPIVPIQLQGVSLSYVWTPSTYLNRADTPSVITTPLADITYTLTVTGEGGCTASDAIFVKALKKPGIPTAFSPNGDGIHDKWIIQYLADYPGATVEVFDRFGKRVYNATNHSTANAWDGKANGQILPTGTYYYIITPGHGRDRFTGYIYLLR